MSKAVVRDCNSSLFLHPFIAVGPVLVREGPPRRINRRDAGSIPATADGCYWKSSGRKQCPAADRLGRKEARAAVEEQRSKAGAGKMSVVGSSPSASALLEVLMV